MKHPKYTLEDIKLTPQKPPIKYKAIYQVINSLNDNDSKYKVIEKIIDNLLDK